MKPSLTEAQLFALESEDIIGDRRITFRPIADKDLPFLAELYASTREQELAVLDWSPEQKATFLQMQFEAQHAHYLQHYGDASFDVIEQGQPIGRLYLDRRQTEIRIIDIALLPAFRNQGIGSRLLKAILAEALQVGLPVRIHVEQFNPALRLYRRLGFQSVEDRGVYYLMEWSPEGGGQEV